MQKIAIHSVPRSGSTWLGNIFNSHPDVNFVFQPLFSYAFKNALAENSTSAEIENFFREISLSEDPFVKQTKGISENKIPNFFKSKNSSHICYKEVRYHHIIKNLLERDSSIKVVGLVRSPMATLYSWLTAPKEFRGELGWIIEEEWKYAPKKNLQKPEEFNGYEKWKEVIFLFEELETLYPERFILINYSDLLNDTNAVVRDLFSFCELPIAPQTLAFINPSIVHNDEDAYSVFKSKVSDNEWVGKLQSGIVAEISADPEFIELNKRFKWI